MIGVNYIMSMAFAITKNNGNQNVEKIMYGCLHFLHTIIWNPRPTYPKRTWYFVLTISCSTWI